MNLSLFSGQKSLFSSGFQAGSSRTHVKSSIPIMKSCQETRCSKAGAIGEGYPGVLNMMQGKIQQRL
jgi:hypothetical protein